MTERTSKLTEMDAAHRERVVQIRADGDLTYEARERRVKEAGDKHYASRREEEQRVADGLDSEVEAAYRRAHGPAPITSAAADTARELRLSRLRAEVTDDFEAGRQDPIRGFEQAVRAGDAERAEVIGKAGARYLQGFRRGRLAELVEENLPPARKRERDRLAALELEREDIELGLAISRRAPARTGR